jgi:hypothetical protein
VLITAAASAAAAGITFTELLRFATSQNLTVPLGVTPQYADLTIGGTLASGAHGLGGRGNANVVSPCCNPFTSAQIQNLSAKLGGAAGV